MNSPRPDPPRLRLDQTSYEILRQQILHRDGWRCQACGVMSNLEIHHKEFRSHSGHDSEENLITLCTQCHAGVHHNLKSPVPRRIKHLERVTEERMWH